MRSSPSTQEVKKLYHSNPYLLPPTLSTTVVDACYHNLLTML